MSRVHGYNKRAPRVDLRHPAVMVDSDGSAADVTILDVSSGGFRLQLSESPRIGEFVTLHVGRDEHYDAQIRWALGDEAGGVFLTAMGFDEWQESKMGANQSGDGDRRTGDDRRQDERREDGDRREAAGTSAGAGDKRKVDRRASDRRKGDRRG